MMPLRTGGFILSGILVMLTNGLGADLDRVLDPFRGERHPSLDELRSGLKAADVIVRGQIKSVCQIVEGHHPELLAKVEVMRVYAGALPDSDPCFRLEVLASSRLPMGVPDDYDLTVHLPAVGDEVILPVFLVVPRVGLA